MIRRALPEEKKLPTFKWNFFESIAKLKLKQLVAEKNLKFSDYEIVPKLIKKQMEKKG